MAQPPYHGQSGSGSGIPLVSTWPYGVWGDSEEGPGGVGTATTAPGDLRPRARFSFPAGIYGEGRGEGFIGVYGYNRTRTGSGVFGTNVDGTGVSGLSDNGVGTTGTSTAGDGMQARTRSSTKNGIFARNDARSPVPPNTPAGNGVFGLSWVPNASGVFGANNNGGNGVFGISPNGVGVVGSGGVLAGRFEGDVEVTGDITLLGADCAEDFDVSDAEEIDPGTVVVIDREGVLRRSYQAYDKRVAGVISPVPVALSLALFWASRTIPIPTQIGCRWPWLEKWRAKWTLIIRRSR